MLVGYMRVSTSDERQSVDLQHDALLSAGVDERHLHQDSASGARDDRPGLKACIDDLRTGDVLVVWKLDRLGRSLSHLIKIVEQLKQRGVAFRSLTETIDTTSVHGTFLFNLFGTLAEQRLVPVPPFAQRRKLGRQHRRPFAACAIIAPIRTVEPRQIVVEALVGGSDQLRQLGAGEAAVPAVDRFQSGAINRDQLTAEQVEPAAENHEGPEYLLEGAAVVAAEVGDRLEVRAKATKEPDRLQIASRLGFQLPARSNPIEISVDVELQHVSRIVPGPPCGARPCTTKARCTKIEALDERVDESALRTILGDSTSGAAISAA